MRIPFVSEPSRELAVRDSVEIVQAPPPEIVLAPSRSLASLPTLEPALREPAGGAVGKDGSGSWYEGLIAGGPDVNPELVGRLKYEVYREMALSDPAVRSLLWMFMLPIRAADWTLEPAKNDPAGEAVAKARADFAAWNFGLEENEGELDLTWDEWLQQSLTFLRDGSMAEEIIWGDVGEWVDADGDSHLVRPIARFAPRYANTIIEIDEDKQYGRLKRVRQDLPEAGWIPGEKLCWYVMERAESRWYGTSLLRAASGPWKLKKGLQIAAAIAWDRWGAGIPVVRHPTGKKQEAEEIGRNLRVHERAWVTLEGQTPDKGGDSEWDVDIKTAQIQEPINLLRYYDVQIAKAGLQMFGELGNTETGSRAVSETISEPYYLAVMALARYVATMRRKRALRALFDVNFGPDVPTPKVKVSKIQARNVAVLARALADFSSAGLTFTDRDTQNDIRDQLDLRHLPDDVATAIERAVGELPEDVGVEPTLVREEGGSIVSQ